MQKLIDDFEASWDVSDDDPLPSSLLLILILVHLWRGYSFLSQDWPWCPPLSTGEHWHHQAREGGAKND